MGIDDTDSYGESLEPGASDAPGFVPPKTAFVFAGGGSLGAVQVGMLRELMSRGVSADFVVGSSVGAMNASYFASAPNPAGIEKLEKIWRALRRHDVFPVTLQSVLGLLGRPDNLIDPSNLRRLLERHLPIPNLEDSMIPAHVIATSLGGFCGLSLLRPSHRRDHGERGDPRSLSTSSHRRRPPHGRRVSEQHTDPHCSQVGRHSHYRLSSRFCLLSPHAAEWRDRARVACDHPADSSSNGARHEGARGRDRCFHCSQSVSPRYFALRFLLR
jgi:hypothetical protein